MKRHFLVVAALTLSCITSSVQAQQTETFVYDVHGRLQAAAKAPAVGGSVSRYGLDGADNRAGRLTEAVPLRSPVQELQSGQFILASQFIPSADGRFSLHVQLDGNVVLYGPPGYLWSAAGTWGRGSTTLTMQTDGNLTVRGPQNELIWQSGTGGYPGARLAVQNDGNLVIYSGWTAIWHTGTCCY
ncbi:hypothetical protein [Brevundimonas sp.]|uniref:hypothetical protein n=1 Tax=Brevundimonas sp. TaxID=1871086 RepID=UPI003D0C9947